MEIYQIFDSTYSVLQNFFQGSLNLLIGCAVASVVIWLGLFLLQAFGLKTMAKNRGMKKSWMAFIPFVNLWYVGKIAGECNLFGQRMKRGGMYAMIAQILTTVACAVTIIAQVYLLVNFGEPAHYDELGIPHWTSLSGAGTVAYKTFEIVSLVLPVFQLVYEVLILILLIALFKKYAPGNYFFLSILCLFIPNARYIVIFVLRKRSAIDFDAFMRAKREAYIRQQQQYGNYNYPYGAPQSRPTENPYAGQTKPTNDDPFSEFDEKKKKDENSDGFFD